MDIIYIVKNGEDLGGFYLDGINEGLRTGYFVADDLAWKEGMAEWLRLGDLLKPARPALKDPPANPPRTSTLSSGSGLRLATEKQIAYLKDLGGQPYDGMTIEEASDLIKSFGEERRLEKYQLEQREREKHESYYLHKEADEVFTKLLIAKDSYEIKELNADLRDAQKMRVNYWDDLFFDYAYEREEAGQLFEMYGQHFKKPTKVQITMVLGELDQELGADWEMKSASLFFVRLEQRHPQLRKKR